MVEQHSPNISSISREDLAKKSDTVLSEEFALRVNAKAGSMSDGMELATLFARWDGYIDYLAKKEGRHFSPPSNEWVEFVEESISQQESVQLRKLMRTAYSTFHLRTVRDFRNFTSIRVKYPWRIGQRGRAFGYLAFKKKEAENLTLGL
jgi:hypothetical protein